MMPPLQFDHVYQGKLTVKRVDPDQMRLACPKPKPGNTMLGCAHVGQGACEIIILDDASLADLGFNSDIILRHESGHCNGWPADHPNAETA
jgi:hypothetical protein